MSKNNPISVNDNKSKSVALMMKSYVENKFDGSIVSEDCKIKFNQLEMTKKDFVGLGEVHHMMFNDIKFPEGWIETNSYIGKDLKQAGGIYSDSYGQIWTNQWTTWSAVSKITGDTLSNPSNFLTGGMVTKLLRLMQFSLMMHLTVNLIFLWVMMMNKYTSLKCLSMEKVNQRHWNS